MPGTSPGMTIVEAARHLLPQRGEGRRSPYSDIGLSEMSQSLPVKVEM